MKQILNEGKACAVEIIDIVPFVSSNDKIVGFSKLFLADGTQTVLSPEELRRSVTDIPEPEQAAPEAIPEPQPEEPAAEPVKEVEKEETKPEPKQAVRTGTKRSKNK